MKNQNKQMHTIYDLVYRSKKTSGTTDLYATQYIITRQNESSHKQKHVRKKSRKCLRLLKKPSTEVPATKASATETVVE